MSGKEMTMDKDFEYAVACTKLLQDHIDEEVELDDVEIQVCVHHIKEMSIKSKFFFDKYVLGFTLFTEETHKTWDLDLQNCLDRRVEKLMRLKPRATYKTSLYGIALILWLWSCVSPALRLFYTSANAVLLEEVSDTLDRFLNPTNDSIFQRVFGLTRDDKGQSAAKNTGDVFNIKGRSGKGFSLIMRTAGGSSNGLHPHIIIIDDACDKEDRESAVVRSKKERWFESLIPLLVPFKFEDDRPDIMFLIMVSTRWHANDICDYVLKQHERTGEWDIEVESIYNEEGESNYPEFISNEKIASLKNSMSDVFFSCQYINNPLSESMQIFNPKMLHYVPVNEIKMAEGQRMCFFDPAKGTEKGDYPAVIFTVYLEGKLTIFDAIDEKILLAKLIPIIAAKNRMYGISKMVFENIGSSLIKEALIDAHRAIGHTIQIEEINHRTNKEERIISSQPDLYSGFCRFREDWAEAYPQLMEQLIYYPVHNHDDFPDIIETAISYYRKSAFTFIRYEGIS